MIRFALWPLLCVAVISDATNDTNATSKPTTLKMGATTQSTTVAVSTTPLPTQPQPAAKEEKKKGSLPTCSAAQVKYMYTECDVNKGRWKVQVPRQPNTCTLAKPTGPERGKHCSFSCPEGQYLDINTQKCRKCKAGTYSLSGGVRFRSWEKLPEGFDTWGRDADDDERPFDSEFSHCQGANWTAKGQYIESAGQFCKSVLVYSVMLETEGKLYVTYRGDDEMAFFHIKVVNNYCSESKNGQHHFYLDVAQYYKRSVLNLTKGRNVIFFEAAYFYDDTAGGPGNDEEGEFSDDGNDNPIKEDESMTDEYTSSSDRSVQISEIKITGLSYTSECTQCEAGTYSGLGSSRCEECDINTFSKRGNAVCTKCKPEEYSAKGASTCKPRPKCTEKDYYETWTPCDVKDMTKKTYAWVQPKICSGGVPLPTANTQIKCPPCNPGQFKNGTHCSFCPRGQFSDGNSACKKCPPSTSPNNGLYLMFWQNLPKDALHLYCLSRNERACTTEEGFVNMNTYLDSGVGHSDDADLGLYFHVSEFTKFDSQLVFEFELDCKSPCRLFLEERRGNDSPRIIGKWQGKTHKRKFTHQIIGQVRARYRLSFQKPNKPGEVSYKYTNDRVKIYALNVTNALNGGADRCLDCPLGVVLKGCVTCKVGKYLDVTQKKCMDCPKHHFVNSSNAVGRQSCMKCPPGTISSPGATSCRSDCHYYSPSGKHYDFSGLNGSFTYEGPKMFTSHSYPYYHYFNISICGKNTHSVHCYNNLTHDDFRNHKKPKVSALAASVCRTTVIPSEKGGKLFAQSMSLGDYLISVTEGDPFAVNVEKKDNVSVHVIKRRTRRHLTEEHRGDLVNDTQPTDVNFLFGSHTTTGRCRDGFSTLVTVRCDPTAKGRGFIRMPKRCPQGTCHGCLFHFYWHSESACPFCTTADYMNITSACKDGKVTTRHVWNFPKVCRDGVTLPATNTRACSIFEKSLMDLKIVLLVFLCFAIFLAISVMVLCYRNRKLTYKYHRLVDGANMKDGELPAVETCTLEEGEEDEEVIISRGSSGGKRILDRLKNKIGNPKGRGNFDEFETINLKEYNHNSGYDDNMSD